MMISVSRFGAAFALTLFGLCGGAHAGPAIQTWSTPNGARVFYVENHALPLVDVQVDFRAGGAESPAGKTGVAGLTHALLDNGAGDLDEEAIANRIADLGAQMGGSADMDRASITLRTLSSAAERDGAVDLLATVIQHPTFPAASFEREKARTLAGLKESDTQPDAILSRRFAAAVFPGHPYGRLPTVDSVAALNRDDLAAFHARTYTAARAVVSIVGDVSRAEAEAMAAKLTADLPRGEAPATSVNTVLPGWIVTDMTQRSVNNEKFAGAVLPRIPARRWGEIDDFGGIAVYLASAASAYTTGEQFVIDGGYTKF
ncbi:MAG TPA: pitrilysin family protein [Rhodocyclaceae bacterium]|nr:pitrilysin family protein [Rhodocyclaceae bacterium]